MKKKAYLIGAGGAGMSALAKYLYTEGFVVMGSDAQRTDTIRDLEENYDFVFTGEQKEENISPDLSVVIYTPAVESGNPEYDKAHTLGLEMFSYPEYLGVISQNKKTIAIAGTNGKTTTTTMVGELLVNAGLDPTIIVGGVMSAFGTNYKQGQSDYFVVEACEYKNSFHALYPEIAIITNITPDHLDFFGTVENYKQSFITFVKNIKEGGVLICNTQDPELKEIIDAAQERNIEIINYVEQPELSLATPGRHTIQNAQVALGVGDALSVDRKQAQEYLSRSFKGSKRRFEYKGVTEQGHDVYDDYAHNPEALEVLIDGVKERYLKKHIVLVFQPHEYPRTKEFFNEFANELSKVDTLVLPPIYKARKPIDNSVSSVLLGGAVKKINSTIELYTPDSLDETVRVIKNLGRSKETIILVVGAGDIVTIFPHIIS